MSNENCANWAEGAPEPRNELEEWILQEHGESSLRGARRFLEAPEPEETAKARTAKLSPEYDEDRVANNRDWRTDSWPHRKLHSWEIDVEDEDDGDSPNQGISS